MVCGGVFGEGVGGLERREMDLGFCGLGMEDKIRRHVEGEGDIADGSDVLSDVVAGGAVAAGGGVF